MMGQYICIPKGRSLARSLAVLCFIEDLQKRLDPSYYLHNKQLGLLQSDQLWLRTKANLLQRQKTSPQIFCWSTGTPYGGL